MSAVICIVYVLQYLLVYTLFQTSSSTELFQNSMLVRLACSRFFNASRSRFAFRYPMKTATSMASCSGIWSMMRFNSSLLMLTISRPFRRGTFIVSQSISFPESLLLPFLTKPKRGKSLYTSNELSAEL